MLTCGLFCLFQTFIDLTAADFSAAPLELSWLQLTFNMQSGGRLKFMEKHRKKV